MSHLIDGYDYLQSVAVQMPPSLRDLATKSHTKLMESAQLMTPDLQDFVTEQDRQLESVRQDLQDITQKRISNRVLSRQLIHNNTRDKQSSQSTLTLLRNRPATERIAATPSASALAAQRKAVDAKKQDAITPGLLPIPTYRPSHQSVVSNASNDNRGTVFTQRLTARAVNGVMVPNMRPGYLPPEVLQLATEPVDMSTPKR